MTHLAGSEHNVYNTEACDLHLTVGCLQCMPAQPVCGRCGMPAHKVADATENGQPVEIWHHDSVADDVFCGLVMHAADRLPHEFVAPDPGTRDAKFGWCAQCGQAAHAFVHASAADRAAFLANEASR